MLSFCPYCNNMLPVSKGDSGVYRLGCPSCPYEFPIEGVEIYDRRNLPRKEVDDVLGGEGAWDNVDQTAVQCPQHETCGGEKAYFFQLQIRSADEPMTTFYKCVTCGHKWREN
ncbi:AGR029Wp [Eremothecium gossypii ATCC 10895]|uniref:DNA-directed RNA polymerase subunit n=1 Tax=Eremothecium gossypii (strain ATCC 10895 / CBS 109.51 / FGSC 9923 / NRRL Y-1056) TaxID=284811 RepID=Q750C6_EREGS|nr:AGR029Wp [Eremothecium gossypii ATCC 10895]AAS54518.1 AGR029Wp [Eremothecium gossypii ATCC 10895]AEY98850.1 FAGR029Wp [Eremothecium gossypii FDAG1]AGO13894.1 AaceriAGR029Wp [[Ashbya] aceris (nom. inval.)]